jgi:putative MATE family efflux protein
LLIKKITELELKKLRLQLLTISAPFIVQNLVQYFQLQVDMAMLGRFNVHYLSAVGNVLFPYTIIVSFLTALSTGATVLISHNIGSKSLNSARRFSEVSFFYNMAASIPLFFLLFGFAPFLMDWMGTSGIIRTYATEYMKYLSFSIIFISIELSIVSTIQGLGKTKAIMYAAVLRTLTHIIFDWILIYGRFGFPQLGIMGAAIATTISNFVGMLYLAIEFLISKKYLFKPTIKGMLNPRWGVQKNNIFVGLPYGLEAMFWTFGQIVLIRMVNELDDFAAGTYVVITRIQAFTFFFYLGMAKATLTLVGQMIGARKSKLAISISYISLRYALLLCLIASTLFISMPQKILSIFTSDANLIHECVPLLFIISLTIFPVSVNVVIGNAIRGLKDTKWMMYTQTFGTVFTIVFSAIVLFVFNAGLKAVFIVIFFDELIRATLNFRRFYRVTKEFN